MTPKNTPAAIIVHGAWATPALYSSFTKQLSDRGWEVHCPHLPTCSGSRPPTSTRDDDIALIRTIIKQLANAGHPMFILMHSYGGLVGQEAALEEHSFASRSKSGLPGGIVHLVFMSAFMVLPGENVVQAQGHGSGGAEEQDARTANSKEVDAEYYNDGTAKLLSAAKTSFTLLSKEEADHWASQLPVFPVAAGMAPARAAAYKDIATTYVHCRLDNSIFLGIQERMVRRAKEHVGIRDFEEEYIEADHSPQLSRPADVCDVLGKMWAAFKKARNIEE